MNDQVLPISGENTSSNPAISTDNRAFEVRSALAMWGHIFLWFGVLIAIGCLITSGIVTKQLSIDKWGENGFSWPYIAFGIGAFIQGLIVKLFLDGFNEIIRLLSNNSGK